MHSSWVSHSPLLVGDWESQLREFEAVATQEQRAREERIVVSTSQQFTQPPTPSTSQQTSQPPPLGASQQSLSLRLPDLLPSDSPSMGSPLFQTQAASPLSAASEASAGSAGLSTQRASRDVTRETAGSPAVRPASCSIFPLISVCLFLDSGGAISVGLRLEARSFSWWCISRVYWSRKFRPLLNHKYGNNPRTTVQKVYQSSQELPPR
jgi:hypothetical protein